MRESDVRSNNQNEKWMLRLRQWAKTYNTKSYHHGHEPIPKDNDSLLNLKELDFSHREVSDLPPEIGNLTKLTKLKLSCNQISALPPEIGKLTDLTELDLTGSNLKTLPPEIGNLTNLTKLGLSSNQISELPIEIGNLKKLRSIHMKGNPITRLPDTISGSESLEELLLWGDNFSDFPDVILTIPNMKELSFSIPKTCTLSLCIQKLNQMTSLTKLCLFARETAAEGSKPTHLHPDIGKLVNLRHLDIPNNHIEKLPPEIGNLEKLERLVLKDNDLRELPAEITKLKNLKSLDASGNEKLLLYKYQGDWRERLSEKGFYCQGIRTWRIPKEDMLPPHDIKDVVIGEVFDNLIFLQKIIEAKGSVFVFFKNDLRDDGNSSAALTILDNSRQRLPLDYGVPDGFVRLRISENGSTRELDIRTASTYSTIHYVNTGQCEEYGLRYFEKNTLVDDKLKEEIQARRTSSRITLEDPFDDPFNTIKYKDQVLLESEYYREIPKQDRALEDFGHLLDFSHESFYEFLTESDFIHFPGKFKATLNEWSITRGMGLVFCAKEYHQKYSDFGYDNWWVDVRADSAYLGPEKRKRFLFQASPRGQIETTWNKYYSEIFKYFYDGKKLLAINYDDMPFLDEAASGCSEPSMKYYPIPADMIDDVFILSKKDCSDSEQGDPVLTSSDFDGLHDNWKAIED